MAYRWPTDPPGKAPSHSVPWANHQASLAAQQQAQARAQQQNATNAAKVAGPAGPAKGLPAGAAPPAAGGAAGGSAGTPAGAVPTFTPDAQFLAEASQRAFNRTQQLNQLTEEATQDKATTGTTIARLLENAMKDRTTINEGANKTGLFYSGQRTKQLGDYETQLQRATSDAQTALDNREKMRVITRAGIEEGGPLDESAALEAAKARAIQRDTDAASVNALVPNAPGAITTAAPPNANLPRTVAGTKRDSKGRTGVWHVYSDGRRVWVPTGR